MPFNLTSNAATFNASGRFGSSINGGFGETSTVIIGAAGNFTVSGWIKLNSLPGAIKVAIAQNGVYWIGCNASNRITANYGGGASNVTLTSTVTMVTGTWYHVELNYSNVTGSTLYVDGTLAASSVVLLAVAGASYTGGSGVNCFGGASGVGFNWNTFGETDDVAIYNAVQHTANFTAPTAAVPNAAAGLLALWHLDGNLLDSAVAVAAATAITMTGPSSGTVSVASTNFTVGANGTITGTVIVTPSDAANGGAFTPTTVSISSATPTATFTYTPATVGAKTISSTNNGALTNPANLTYTASAGTKYTRIDTTDSIGAQNIMVLVPNANAAIPYNSANPTPLIIYAHGVGEDQTGLVTDSLKASSLIAFLDAGYILAGTNARGGNFGSQAAVDDYAALNKYCTDNYNISRTILWSQSMGGLAGLMAITQNKIPNLVGWLGTYPMCSLSANYTVFGGTDFSASINSAYGISGIGNSTYANKTYGQDPALKQGTAFRHLPMRFYASAGDTVVKKSTHTDVLQPIVSSSARESEVVVCTGDHGNASHFQPTDYLAFFARCLASPVATFGQLGGGNSFVLGGGVSLTSAQKTSVKNDINDLVKNPDFAALPNRSDGNFKLAELYNKIAVPEVLVWASNVAIDDVVNTIDSASYIPTDPIPTTTTEASLIFQSRILASQLKQFMLESVLSNRTNVNASLSNNRKRLFDSVTQIPTGAGGSFISSAGANAVNLLSACTRPATRLEVLLLKASTASDTTGSTTARSLGYDGRINLEQIQDARNS